MQKRSQVPGHFSDFQEFSIKVEIFQTFQDAFTKCLSRPKTNFGGLVLIFTPVQ